MKKYQSLPFPFHLQSLYLQSYSFVLCLGDRADLSFPFSLLSPNPLLTATLSKNQFVEMARKLIRKRAPHGWNRNDTVLAQREGGREHLLHQHIPHHALEPLHFDEHLVRLAFPLASLLINLGR